MQSINLQITPSGVMPVVNASQYDYGRLVQFNLYDGASAYIPPEGTEIRVEGRKSDGTVFSYFANYVGNAVIVTLTQQMTVLAEDVPCELRLNVNNEDIGTINFTLAVEPSNIGMAVVSETEIPAIISLARRQELNSEAWANGTRGGVPVSSDDPAYQNNAKWWAEHADLGTLENLLDVNVEDLTDGQILKYDSETDKWVNADEEGGGASSLGDLTDVSLSSPSNKQVLMFNYLQQKWENGDAPSGGMTSHIIVESEAGESSVTVTLPSGTVKTCTQVSGSTTQWETTSDEYGTHIIDAYKNGDDAQASLNIQYVGEYLVHDEHYFHTINVTVKAGASIVITGNGETYGGTGTGSALAFAVHGKEATYTVTTSIDGVSAASQTVTTPATSGQSTSLTFTYGTINLTYANDFRGLSITCSDGNKTITKTAPSGANIMSFYPPNTGTWIISGTVSGQPYSTEAIVVDLAVAVTANIQTVPDGSTVTPTDDIQIWLECAGITDKSYTTLAEVLADSTTLAALIADNNATDYLKRSKSWASNPNLIPYMTSNTTPSGECFGSTKHSSSADYYKAFQGSGMGGLLILSPNGASAGEYVGYKFSNPVLVKKISAQVDAYFGYNATVVVQAYDGSNWVNIVEPQTISSPANPNTEVNHVTFIKDNNTLYSDYRFIRISNTRVGSQFDYFYPSNVQFFAYSGNGITEDSTAMSYIGLNNYCANTLLADSDWNTAIQNSAYFESVDNAKVPAMTDNTHPSGEVVYSSIFASAYDAYKSFDGDNNTFWIPTSNTPNSYVGYRFASLTKTLKLHIRYATQTTSHTSTFKIQGYDGSTWNDIGTVTITGGIATTDEIDVILNNSTNYIACRLFCSEVFFLDNNYNIELKEIQFYGRQDV